MVQMASRALWLQQLTISCPCCLAFVDVQVYESKLQELQKQVETISLVAETPDEEELDEEEEEEGMSPTSPDMSLLLFKKCDNTLCSSHLFPELKQLLCA